MEITHLATNWTYTLDTETLILTSTSTGATRQIIAPDLNRALDALLAAGYADDDWLAQHEGPTCWICDGTHTGPCPLEEAGAYDGPGHAWER